MVTRRFIFCDLCNPQGVRIPEQRRNARRDARDGRRVTDGRMWFDGDINEAVADYGWLVTEEGRHICPYCRLIIEQTEQDAE